MDKPSLHNFLSSTLYNFTLAPNSFIFFHFGTLITVFYHPFLLYKSFTPPSLLTHNIALHKNMISTSTPLFLQTPPPPVNIFSSGDNSALSPSSVRFRLSDNFTAGAATCAAVETESPTSPYSLYTTLKPASFYEVLGIPVGASIQEIKAAYRRLARICHPDVAAPDTSADDFMKIHSAYCTLSDPEKRADYDRRLTRRRRSVNLYSDACSPSGFTGGYTPRNWETDQCW